MEENNLFSKTFQIWKSFSTKIQHSPYLLWLSYVAYGVSCLMLTSLNAACQSNKRELHSERKSHKRYKKYELKDQ